MLRCPGGLETTAELTGFSGTPYRTGHTSLYLDLVEHWKPPGIKLVEYQFYCR